MSTLDTTALLNLIISGLIGLVFGIISAWITHRFQMKREKLAWQREKEKLQERFEQEKFLLKLEFDQKLVELEKHAGQQQSNQVKAELLKGVDNPEEVIRRFKKYSELIYQMQQDKSTLILKMHDNFFADILPRLKELIEAKGSKNLKVLEEINEKKKALDAEEITEQEFQEAFREILQKISNEDQEAG